MQGWELLSDYVGGAHSYLIEYYKACKRGDKIIGRELMTTLDGLIADIQRPEYRFTLARPHKRIKFIETQIKHFESPFAGQPFILTIEQKAIAEAVFGFEIFDEEYGEFVRRFKEVLLLVGRKNGKTPFIAALTLSEWFCGEAGQRVMCASNDYEQASLVFDCIDNFRDQSSALDRVTRRNNFGIYFGNRKQRRTRGKFSRQNKGTIKKMSAKAGAKEGRNLKIVIVDEIHEMQDRLTVMPLRSSLTTQKEPLFFEITTEGIVNDGYLDERLRDARKVLRGELDRPRWLIWLYTQDSEAEVWADESTWVKSNPLLGVVKKWSDLRDLVEEARINGAQRAFTLAKEFNIKAARPRAWLDDAVILNDLPAFRLEDFRGAWCICGVDLSETNDLSAASFLFMKPNDPTKYIYTMYFVPEKKAIDPTTTESPTNKEKKNYIDWRDEGYCRIVKGDFIPDDTVANYILKIHDTYGIRPLRVGYDEYYASEFKKIIGQRFGAHIPVSIRMTPAALDFATRAVENDLRAKRMNYGQNPVCVWNFRNASLRYDSVGRCMPEKLFDFIGNKIDGVMSKTIAYATLRQVYNAFMRKVG